MTRKMAIPYVSFVIDNAFNGRRLGDDQHAIVTNDSVLVGWQCGFEPLFVAVNDYLGGSVDADEAAELAMDYLAERKSFSGEPKEPDYIIV